MGKPYSNDLRERVVASIEAGHTRVEVAELYNMALSTVGGFIKRKRETGSISPDKFGGYKTFALEGHTALVNPDHASRLAFFPAGPAHARRRSVRLDRFALTRCATHWGLICLVGGSSGRAAPWLRGRTASGQAQRRGRELPVDARADGRRRHRCHFDPGNGRGGGDALGVGVRRPLQKSATLANHRHDLAQDKSFGETALADFSSRSSLGGAVARAGSRLSVIY